MPQQTSKKESEYFFRRGQINIEKDTRDLGLQKVEGAFLMHFQSCLANRVCSKSYLS